MPLPIQGSVFTNRLKQLFGFRGRYIITLEESVLPVVQIGDVAPAAVPAVRRVASGQFSEAAGGAGELATVVLSVPPGVITRVRKILCIPTTAQRVLATMDGAGAINTAAFVAKDLGYFEDRLVATGEVDPATNVVSGTQAGSISPSNWTDFFEAAPTGTAWRDVNWYVGTGHPVNFGFLGLQATVANEAIRWGFDIEEFQEL